MKRGGRRDGAGRPRVLSDEELERIGAACERVWYWLSDYRRPYYFRPYVLLAAAIYYTSHSDAFITTRRIEAAWKLARRERIGRAQPGNPAYEDARSIEHYLETKLELENPELLFAARFQNLEQLALIHREMISA